MAQRIKGQDVNLTLTVNGALKKSVTDIKSLELTSQLSILTEGYLGETSNRRDSIFNGVKGKIEFHLEDPAILDVIRDRERGACACGRREGDDHFRPELPLWRDSDRDDPQRLLR